MCSQSTHDGENNYHYNSGGLHSLGRSHYSHRATPVWMCAGEGSGVRVGNNQTVSEND